MAAAEEEQHEKGMLLDSIGVRADFCVELEVYQLTVVLPPGQTPRTIKVIVSSRT